MSLTDAIRDLLDAAGNAGASVADMLPTLRPLVPDGQAATAAARLARAGRENRDGHRRVIQDRLNVLVQRGEVTARGDGDERRYFTTTTTEATPMLDRPRPKREQVPLERLTFDVRLQQRAGLGEKGYSESAAAEYLDRINDLGTEPPALRAVYEQATGTYWVFGGFNTGESLRRAGRNSAEVDVWPGTFLDALFYSLPENGNQSVLPRTNADKQKALSTLLGNRELLDRVLDEAADDVGVIRGIARAVGVSKGMVTEALKARGLRATRNGTIVKAAPKAEPTPPPPPAKPAKPSPAADQAAPPAAPETTARATPDADRVERQGADPSPEPDESEDPHSQEPEWIRAALAERVVFDQLIRDLTVCAHKLDRVSQGPSGTFLRKVVAADGEAFVREMRVKRGQSTTLVYAQPALLWLIRLLKRARPDQKCGGCNGEGCSCCRDVGILPANLDLLPVAGETGDLFDTVELRDVWDA